MNKQDIVDFAEAINQHLGSFIEEDELIVFEDSALGDIDVVWIKPSVDRPYSMLMTYGLSAKPMNVPKGQEDKKYAELVMLLPQSWNLDDDDWDLEENSWPVDHLRTVAELTLNDNSWIGFGHLSTFDVDDNQCFPGTSFNSTVALQSMTLPEIFTTIPFNAENIHLYTLVPLFIEELMFVESNDVNQLIDKFNQYKVSEIVDVDRINTCL